MDEKNSCVASIWDVNSIEDVVLDKRIEKLFSYV